LGVRVYHIPWQRDYARMKIDEAAGERWFCGEGKAASGMPASGALMCSCARSNKKGQPGRPLLLAFVQV